MARALRLSLVGLLLASCSGSGSGSGSSGSGSGSGKAPRPHLVMFIVDDLGWANVGWHAKDSECALCQAEPSRPLTGRSLSQ